MDNNKILTARWNYIDEYLQEYLSKYEKENQAMREKLQDMLDTLNISYDDLNKTVPKNRKKRIDRKIQETLNEEIEENYFFFYLFNILSKKTITYRELIEAMIYLEIYEQRQKLSLYENKLYSEVVEKSYNLGIKDLELSNKKNKIVLFNDEILYLILNIPLLYGTREAYMWALDLSIAQELNKKILMSIQHEKEINLFIGKYDDFFKKCRNRYICINDNKYSGTIESLLESYSNLGYLEAGKQNEIRSCRFIAEMDDKTTKMCESLNNQIFFLDRVNTYQRYSDIDKRIVTYSTKGLVLGDNLPPINNHFHWCRSTITYLTQYEETDIARMKERGNNNEE